MFFLALERVELKENIGNSETGAVIAWLVVHFIISGSPMLSLKGWFVCFFLRLSTALYNFLKNMNHSSYWLHTIPISFSALFPPLVVCLQSRYLLGYSPFSRQLLAFFSIKWLTENFKHPVLACIRSASCSACESLLILPQQAAIARISFTLHWVRWSHMLSEHILISPKFSTTMIHKTCTLILLSPWHNKH